MYKKITLLVLLLALPLRDSVSEEVDTFRLKVLKTEQLPNVTQNILTTFEARERVFSYLFECKYQGLGDRGIIEGLDIKLSDKYPSFYPEEMQWIVHFSNFIVDLLEEKIPDEVSEADFNAHIQTMVFRLLKSYKRVAFKDFLANESAFKDACENLTDYIKPMTAHLDTLIKMHQGEITDFYVNTPVDIIQQDLSNWSSSLHNSTLVSTSPDNQYRLYYSEYNMPPIHFYKNNIGGVIHLFDIKEKVILEKAYVKFFSSTQSDADWSSNTVGFKTEGLPHWRLPRPIGRTSECLESDTESEKKYNLELTFNDSSWVDIRDSNGCRLAYKNYHPGEILKVSSASKVEIFIGNAKAVVLLSEGLYFDTSKYIEGTFARFSIGE